MRRLHLLTVFVAALSVACSKSPAAQHATIETDKGSMEVEFFPSDAPKAVENFQLLAERGYYNNTTFHRIIPGFMIQGGDPKGDGTGGESAWGGTFADEINRGSALYRGGYKRGYLAMANAGPNTNGSQFFIMHRDYPLSPDYVIFGKVTSGLDVLDALASVPTSMGSDGERSKPIQPLVIRKISIKP
jgi:cyclophilin family peptidyl-prolyl cis-trans isomerase